jgi:peptidoglycan/xylan/chitin deacetylase (PgdA/CDA1 family)
VIETIRSLGMEPIQWSVDSLDWKEISAEEITDRVLGQIESGSIVLFHNAALHTPEALPGILEQLLSDGYTIVPISELIIQGDYTIDAAGCQHSA